MASSLGLLGLLLLCASCHGQQTKWLPAQFPNPTKDVNFCGRGQCVRFAPHCQLNCNSKWCPYYRVIISCLVSRLALWIYTRAAFVCSAVYVNTKVQKGASSILSQSHQFAYLEHAKGHTRHGDMAGLATCWVTFISVY